ncbi:sensor histidine kinase, partial [Chloroflexota bacterium]
HSGIGRRFSQQIETTVFRVIQEATTNVVRHAQTDQVVVRVWFHSQSLGLQIKDFGLGFDPAAIRTSGRTTGLSGIEERIALCNGQLTIETQYQQGTNITAEIPIPD